MRERDDIDAIRDVPLLDVARQYGVALKKRGRDWWGLSPFKAERTASFKVNPGRNGFKCFSSGEAGGVIDFVMLMDGCDFKTAVAKLRDQAGLGDPVEAARRAERWREQQRRIEEREAAQRARNIELAREIWRESRPATGTIVDAYLGECRCIDLNSIEKVYGFRIPPTIRLHPALRWRYDGDEYCGPAMVGALTYNGKLVAVHRTWLKPDGSGKADLTKNKMILGPSWGAEWRLTPLAAKALVGEGCETTCTPIGALAARGEAACGICATSLGNLAGRGWGEEPDPECNSMRMPAGVVESVVLQDNDGKDPDNAAMLTRRAARKFEAQGVAARIAVPPRGYDFNKMAMEGLDAAA